MTKVGLFCIAIKLQADCIAGKNYLSRCEFMLCEIHTHHLLTDHNLQLQGMESSLNEKIMLMGIHFELVLKF